MANQTTGAQRANKRYDKIWDTYLLQQRFEKFKDTLPTVMDYSNFLDRVEKRLKITRNEARNKYGRILQY